MKHLFIEKDRTQPTLLLLNGTGGDEQSLVDIAGFIAPDSSLLGIRGRISEDGANRYFRRFAEGQFDLESLAQESEVLLAEIKRLADVYQLSLSELVILGYSNGANIGAHLMLEYANSLVQVILLHPMSLGKGEQTFSLANQRVWLSYGQEDPIVPRESFTELVEAFDKRQAQTTVYEGVMGHGLTKGELSAAKSWFEELK